MEYAIVYESKTGNTKKLIDVIKKSINGDCVYEGAVIKIEDLPELVFVGSGAENANFYPNILEFLKESRDKQIFLFGTVGYQNTQTYYNRVIKSVKTSVYPGNKVLGDFLCQGKVPDFIKEKCEKMDRSKAKFDVDAFLRGFEETAKHPNEDDFKNFEIYLNRVFPK